MSETRIWIPVSIGLAAGLVTGIFGGGGGMILVPLLTLLPGLKEEGLFPASISIILPICIVCIFLTKPESPLSWQAVTPYLAGSFLGGVFAGICGKKIPIRWLHRILGLLILWGGIRYLWQTTS